MDRLIKNTSKGLENFFRLPYVYTVLFIVLVMYASLAAPNLPPFLSSLFGNPVFKVVFMSLILVMRRFEPVLALMVSIGFVLSLQTFHRHQSFAMLKDWTQNLKQGVSNAGQEVSKAGQEMSNAGQEVSKETQEVSDWVGHSEDQLHAPLDIDQAPVQVTTASIDENQLEENMGTRISGLCTEDILGSQGLEKPYGFAGVSYGAPYGTPNSEL